jgi:hypothetical protein
VIPRINSTNVSVVKPRARNQGSVARHSDQQVAAVIPFPFLQNVAREVAPTPDEWTLQEIASLDNCLILFGSPGRIRTIDQPVNSRLLYR